MLSKASEIACATDDMATTAARIRVGLMFAVELCGNGKGKGVLARSEKLHTAQAKDRASEGAEGRAESRSGSSGLVVRVFGGAGVVSNTRANAGATQ
jgi:hypothetical protein